MFGLHSSEALICWLVRRLAESVTASLEGQALGSFTRVSAAVRLAVEAALTRILTPKRSIDILREVGCALFEPELWLFRSRSMTSLNRTELEEVLRFLTEISKLELANGQCAEFANFLRSRIPCWSEGRT